MQLNPNQDGCIYCRLPVFVYTKERGLFHVHNKCGRTKDAADFAICLTVSPFFWGGERFCFSTITWSTVWFHNCTQDEFIVTICSKAYYDMLVLPMG